VSNITGEAIFSDSRRDFDDIADCLSSTYRRPITRASSSRNPRLSAKSPLLRHSTRMSSSAWSDTAAPTIYPHTPTSSLFPKRANYRHFSARTPPLRLRRLRSSNRSWAGEHADLPPNRFCSLARRRRACRRIGDRRSRIFLACSRSASAEHGFSWLGCPGIHT